MFLKKMLKELFTNFDDDLLVADPVEKAEFEEFRQEQEDRKKLKIVQFNPEENCQTKSHMSMKPFSSEIDLIVPNIWWD